MTEALQFVDIHCHMLPGLDDGAVNLGVSLAMAEMAAADGIATVVVTPHQLGNYSRNRGATVRAYVERFQRELDQRRIPLRVLPGADVRIEPDMIAGLQAGDVISLADRRRHVLLELPHELYVPLEGLLKSLRAVGMVGVLSHPERNEGILRDPHVAVDLVEAGCLMQVTAGSFVGSFGPDVEQFAEWMLEEGLVHFVATDAHGTTSRRPLMSPAFFRVAELAGQRRAEELCCLNPAAVATGRQVAAGRHAATVGARAWFRRSRAS
ncbi:MAG: tyrosine-protein phosphatase [Thermoguttaceae bacterium]